MVPFSFGGHALLALAQGALAGLGYWWAGLDAPVLLGVALFGPRNANVNLAPYAPLPEEVLAIEEHRFPRLENLYWRDGDPDFSSLDRLIRDLERRMQDEVQKLTDRHVVEVDKMLADKEKEIMTI